MTEKKIIAEIYTALAEYINPVVEGTRYDSKWITALVNRECGWKVAREVGNGKSVIESLEGMRGDYVKSLGGYQGYSPFQIDIKSYPLFIHSGDWKDLKKAAAKCVDVLEEKRKSLEAYGYTEEKLGRHLFNRCITAAYNCGAGGVRRSMQASGNTNPDLRTYSKDYSKEVFRMIGVVWQIERELNPGTEVPEEVQAQAIDGEDREVCPPPKPAGAN